MPPDNRNQIVRTEYDLNARTCEGETYNCADGSRWTRVYGFIIGTKTGETVGQKIGEQIIQTN